MHQNFPQARSFFTKLLDLSQNWDNVRNLPPAHSHGAVTFLDYDKSKEMDPPTHWGIGEYSGKEIATRKASNYIQTRN